MLSASCLIAGTPLAMKDGDSFPADAWPVPGELRRAIGLVPNAQADEGNARFLQKRGMLPGARHDNPTLCLRHCIAAKLNELFLGQAVEIYPRCGERLRGACASVRLRVVWRVGDDAIDLAKLRHDLERIRQIECGIADLFFAHGWTQSRHPARARRNHRSFGACDETA